MTLLISNLKKFVKIFLPSSMHFRPKLKKMIHWLEETQHWDKEQQTEWQLKKLRKLVLHAYANVPYYKKIMDAAQVIPSDIRTENDLKIFPVLKKADLIKHKNDLIARNFSQFKALNYHTSGSTGQPVYYFLDKKLQYFIRAIVARHFSWCGVKPWERIAVFRGTLIDQFGNPKSKLWRREDNCLHFSSFNMNESVLSEYSLQLEDYKPNLVRGYLSSLEILARFILRTKPLKWRPKAVHTSSEIVHSDQRKIIEEAFNAPLYDWYSHGESTVAAGQCSYRSGYHLNWELGLTEFHPIIKQENQYSIVSTCLWNYSMPLIRYESEDLAEIYPHNLDDCPCKRKMPIIQRIIGRQSDIIYGINGISLSPSALVHFWKFQIDTQVECIDSYQIVQWENLSLDVYIKANQAYSIKDEQFIVKKLKELLGNVELNFHLTDDFPSGQKWRVTLQKKR